MDDKERIREVNEAIQAIEEAEIHLAEVLAKLWTQQKPKPELFRRENRYLVLKWTDVHRAMLTEAEWTFLERLGDKIDDAREKAGKPALTGVFVEANWPEYEPVWKMIEERVMNEKAESFVR